MTGRQKKGSRDQATTIIYFMDAQFEINYPLLFEQLANKFVTVVDIAIP